MILASWKFARDVKVDHLDKFRWVASRLRLAKICKIKTFKRKTQIIPNVDQKTNIQSLYVVNVVLPTSALKNQAGMLTFDGDIDFGRGHQHQFSCFDSTNLILHPIIYLIKVVSSSQNGMGLYGISYTGER